MAIGTTAAIIGGSVIGAGASMLGASKASKAQKHAARMAAQTERENIALQREIFNQQREDFAPWREAGKTRLADLLSGTAMGGDFNRDFTMADFREDPGYQFRLAEGQKALERSAAARGGLFSGATGKRLVDFAQGAASQEFGNAYNRFNEDRTRRFNRLASIAQVGQTATNSTAQAGQGFGQNVGSALGNIANLQTQAGNARASGYAAMGQGINQAIGNGMNAMMMSQFLKPPAPGGSTLPNSGLGHIY